MYGTLEVQCIYQCIPVTTVVHMKIMSFKMTPKYDFFFLYISQDIYMYDTHEKHIE